MIEWTRALARGVAGGLASGVPGALALMTLRRDYRRFLRLNFIHAAARAGLIDVLDRPRPVAELVDELGVTRPDLFDAFLRAGASVGALRLDGTLVAPRGLARAARSRGAEWLAPSVDEWVAYHGAVYEGLAERLRGAPLGDYLGANAATVARASLKVEPVLRAFLLRETRSATATTYVDLGCGSGRYLEAVGRARRDLRGYGVEIQPDVAREAAARLDAAGLATRFEILTGDIRTVVPLLPTGCGVMSLLNNVYYFAPEERPALFESLRERLAPDGSLVLASLCRGGTPGASSLDVVLMSTEGCHALPALDALPAQLREAGFTSVRAERLLPLEPYYGLVARR